MKNAAVKKQSAGALLFKFLVKSDNGVWSREQVGRLFTQILPGMFQLAATGKLKVETIEVKLKDIANCGI